jgi:hypothetical protein
MLDSSRAQILSQLSGRDQVLDVGGWADPFERADWVIDLMPYETRGLYGSSDPARERFSADTWVVRDICDRDPWPFADDQFDFAVCSHTLEDVRDPVGVCRELVRVAKAGYIETPSRLEEQAFGVQGPWAGWGHHHWLVDTTDDGLMFVFKHHIINGRPELQVPRERWRDAWPEERTLSLWWEGSFEARERVFIESGEADGYLGAVASQRPSRWARLRRRALVPASVSRRT